METLTTRELLSPTLLNKIMAPYVQANHDDDEPSIPSQRARTTSLYQDKNNEVVSDMDEAHGRLREMNKSSVMSTTWYHWGRTVKPLQPGQWQCNFRSRFLLPDTTPQVCPNCHRAHRKHGHAAGCSRDVHKTRHDCIPRRIKTILNDTHLVQLEPEAHENGAMRRADIQIEPRRGTNQDATVLADLRIVEAESETALKKYAKVKNSTGDKLAQAQTTQLLNYGYESKFKEFSKRGIFGVMPWICTTLGAIHPAFDKWIDTLERRKAREIRAAIGWSLLKARARIAAHRDGNGTKGTGIY